MGGEFDMSLRTHGEPHVFAACFAANQIVFESNIIQTTDFDHG